MSVVELVPEGQNYRQASRPTTELRHEAPGRMTLKEAVGLYEVVGRRNGSNLFNWLHNVYAWICLPCVSVDYRITLAEDKTKIAMFGVLADDLADKPDAARTRPLLEDFMRIPSEGADARKDPYLEIGRRIWEDAIKSIRTYPRFRYFESQFYFDLRQVLAAMDYSSLSNMTDISNPIEMDLYIPHGCQVMQALDMDLMCSPNFDFAELGTMRAIMHMAQRIAHIANMLVTYPREFMERDFSCPLISLAVNRKIIRREELGDRSILPKLKMLEPFFLKRARSYLQRVSFYESQVRSVNITGFHRLLQQLLEMYWEAGESANPLVRPTPSA